MSTVSAAAPGRLDALAEYRDDGVLAVLLGRTAGRRLLVAPVTLTLAGLLPVAAVLAAARPGRVPDLTLGAALVWLVLCAGAAAGAPTATPLGWLVPPLLRLVEYAVLLRLVVLAAGPSDTRGAAVPACFALLAVLAFHHYDTVYRIRARRPPPPAWLRLAGGGWDVRVLLGYALLLGGVLPGGVAVGAVLLGALFVTESVSSWLRPQVEGATAAAAGNPGAEEETDE